MAVTLSIAITQNSQNLGANTSNVTVAASVAWSYGSWNATGQCTGSITIDGTRYDFSGLVFNAGHTNSGSQVVMTKTVDISHNSDGTKTLACSASFATGISAGTVTATASKTLTTIARASVPTVSSTSVDMGGAVTIYTNPESTNFTHDLAYSFAGGAYVTIRTGVGASYSWTTPDLASKIPNATSGTLIIRCTTKNGSTVVGYKNVSMTLKVPATVVPTISTVNITEATSGLAAKFGAYVQGKSTLKVAITAAGAKGSTIKSYKSVVIGASYTGQSFTTDTLLLSGSQSVAVTVTDSRGRTAQKTVTINVLPYSTPAASELRVFRCDINGTPKDDGYYLGMTYAYSVASLGGKNTAYMVIEYKTEAASSWTTLVESTVLQHSSIYFATDRVFSTDYQYNIRMTVTDWFDASASYSVTLSTADVVLDISSDGKGLGIGKVSQRTGATEFAREMYDRFDTLIGNGLATYRDDDYNQIDPNTTIEHLIVTEHENAPESGFWYISTQFYSTKSETANRVQYALPYQYMASMYTRVYHNGVWQDWAKIPILTGDYDVGIWHVRMWSDNWVELTGTYEVSNLACTTALGNWYRTAVFVPGYFPFEIDNPIVTANYESAGYGAMLWATTEATSTQPPSYYLIRPTSATIANGKVQLRVVGRLIDP